MNEPLAPFPPGGFWVRALASVVDGVLIYAASLVLTIAVLGVVYWVNLLASGAGGAFSGGYIQLIFTVISTPLWFVYYLIGHARFGTTFGKRMLGLKVVRTVDGSTPGWGPSAIRVIGYVLSYIPFGAGFLMAVFNKERQTLHDLIAGTRVIRVALALAFLGFMSAPQSASAGLGQPIPQLGVKALALDESRSGGHVYGGRFELGTKWQPIENRGFTIGPKIGADLILGAGSQRGHSLSVGGESAIWLMNAIGLGLGLEHAWLLQDRAGPQRWWVVEPFLRLRMERLGMGGGIGAPCFAGL